MNLQPKAYSLRPPSAFWPSHPLGQVAVLLLLAAAFCATGLQPAGTNDRIFYPAAGVLVARLAPLDGLVNVAIIYSLFAVLRAVLYVAPMRRKQVVERFRNELDSVLAVHSRNRTEPIEQHQPADVPAVKIGNTVAHDRPLAPPPVAWHSREICSAEAYQKATRAVLVVALLVLVFIILGLTITYA